MVRTYKVTIFFVSATLAFSQPTPQQIHQRQMEQEQALRSEAEREQQRHQAQMEQMRQIDRQQAEDAREQAAQQARAAAIAAQQQQFLVQQQMQREAADRAKAQTGNQSPPVAAPQVAPQTPQVQPGFSATGRDGSLVNQ